MPDNTTFSPVSIMEFESTKLQLDAQGSCLQCNINTSTNLDLKMLHDYLVTGIYFKSTGSSFGDSVTMSIVDVDNIIGLGAGVVLRTFGTNWCMTPGENNILLQAQYPAKVLAGLYIRVVYNSVATTGDGPFVVSNYILHKILI